MPQHRFASIHVVGTNGKSSVTRMTAALLEAHGVGSGACLSPHTAHWSERTADPRRGDRASGSGPTRSSGSAKAAEGVNRSLDEGDAVTQFEAATAATFVALADGAGRGGGDRGRARRPARRDQHDPLAGHRADLDRPRPHRVAGGDRAGDRRREAGGPARPDDPGAGPGLGRGRGAGRAHGGRARRPPPPGPRGPGSRGCCCSRRGASSAATSPWRWRPPRPSSASSTPQGWRRSRRPCRSPAGWSGSPGSPPTYVDAAHNPDGAAALAEALPAVTGGRRVVACLAILADKDAAAMIAALAPALDRAVCTELPGEALAAHGRPGAARRPAGELVAAVRRPGCPPRPSRASRRRCGAARSSPPSRPKELCS